MGQSKDCLHGYIESRGDLLMGERSHKKEIAHIALSLFLATLLAALLTAVLTALLNPFPNPFLHPGIDQALGHVFLPARDLGGFERLGQSKDCLHGYIESRGDLLMGERPQKKEVAHIDLSLFLAAFLATLLTSLQTTLLAALLNPFLNPFLHPGID